MATHEFNRAENSRDPKAELLLHRAIRLWEAYLESHADDLEAHEKVAYLLAKAAWRASDRGVEEGSKELRAVRHRIAFHRERMLELSGGQVGSPMQVAYSYQQAGDFVRAERFYLRVRDPLVIFRFYAEEKRPEKAEKVFRLLSGFQERYQAARAALGYRTWEIAIRCGESMLAERMGPHDRAAIHCILAEANSGLRRTEPLMASARKAVQLNPKDPRGWHWLAVAYSGRRYDQWYASEATVLKHELGLITGQAESERSDRGRIYSRLGELYRRGFRHPQIGIQYYRKEIEEYNGLPKNWCGGAYSNIIAATLFELRDRPGALAVLEEAKKFDPSYWQQEPVRKNLRDFGLE
jgi:tetratricopeptide (TPR) repeat protein